MSLFAPLYQTMSTIIVDKVINMLNNININTGFKNTFVPNEHIIRKIKNIYSLWFLYKFKIANYCIMKDCSKEH